LGGWVLGRVGGGRVFRRLDTNLLRSETMLGQLYYSQLRLPSSLDKKVVISNRQLLFKILYSRNDTGLLALQASRINVGESVSG